MISVLSSKNAEEIKALFEKHGRSFCEESGCVIAREGEKALGYCLYYLNSAKMTVLEIEPQNDLSLADGILRSAIHNAVFKNIMNVYYDEKSPEKVFEKLQFILSSDEKSLNSEKLFESCCSCTDKNT